VLLGLWALTIVWFSEQDTALRKLDVTVFRKKGERMPSVSVLFVTITKHGFSVSCVAHLPQVIFSIVANNLQPGALYENPAL
jgi:hypothetical protein